MARPTTMTELIVQKLEEAFALGCSDEEACIYAGICKQTLYNFQEKNLEFLDRKELLKNTPLLQARKVVVESFKSNPHLAFKYLERRKSEEFRLLPPKELPQTITGVEITFDRSFKERVSEPKDEYLKQKYLTL